MLQIQSPHELQYSQRKVASLELMGYVDGYMIKILVSFIKKGSNQVCQFWGSNCITD
ncbi:hypothetical protein pb186bvf_015983 [Paramecium bursaria]